MGSYATLNHGASKAFTLFFQVFSIGWNGFSLFFPHLEDVGCSTTALPGMPIDSILAEGDPTLHFPPRAMRLPRGKKAGRQKVVLPYGFRDDLQDASPPEAEEAGDGG